VAVTVIAAMIVLAWFDPARYREEISLLAALLALSIATIGWLWSGRMAILMARKTNAIAVLERLSGQHVAEIKGVVYPYIEEYNRFKRDDDCKDKPKLPEIEVQKLLGVYEQVSVSVIYGAVDHDMIKMSQSLVFKRVYLGLHHHIERVQEKDPNYFINFESLTCTWHPDLQKRAALLTDPGGLFAPMRNSDI